MVDANMFTEESTAMLTTLQRISMSILHAEADAQDAVQQGLLKAWAKRDAAKPEHFRAWLTRIVINECHNIQRHRMRVMPSDAVESPTPFAPPDMDVHAAIQGLDEKYRIPLLLKYYARYTEAEIARALALPQSTVKSRLFKARRFVQTALAEKEVIFQ